MINKISFSKDKWIAFIKKNPLAKYRLFCFPYAGGSASVFKRWGDFLPNSVEICAIQMPGRANRVSEDSISDMSLLLKNLVKIFPIYLDRPYVFFGHSMGALICFELAKRLQQFWGVAPEYLFISAQQSPDLYKPPKLHKLSDEKFLDAIRRKKGTPKEILDNDELLQYILPTLKNDHAICENYVYMDNDVLECPIVVFGGKNDFSVSYDELTSWKNHTNDDFDSYMFEGDHFYLNPDQSMDALLTVIKDFFENKVV